VPVPDYAQLLRKSGDTRNRRRTSGALPNISANIMSLVSRGNSFQLENTSQYHFYTKNRFPFYVYIIYLYHDGIIQ